MLVEVRSRTGTSPVELRTGSAGSATSLDEPADTPARPPSIPGRLAGNSNNAVARGLHLGPAPRRPDRSDQPDQQPEEKP